MATAPTKTRRSVAAIGTLALALSGVLLTSTPAAAVSSVVNNTDDAGAGSLRQAIIDANSDVDIDTITITATGTITLLSSLPEIDEAVSIAGPGVADLTIVANSYDAFVIVEPVAVSISDLTITNAGTLNAHGAIHNNGGPLTLSNIEVRESWRGLLLLNGHVNATNVSFVDNFDSGAVVELSTGASTFDNVTTSGNGGSGLDVNTWNDATFTAQGTTSEENDRRGIEINADDTSRITFSDTQVNRNGVANGWEGIYAEFSDDAQGAFTDTTANGNGWDGVNVDLDNRTVVTFTNTTANDNLSDGFDGEAAKHARLTLTNTTASNNNSEGLEVTARTGADVIIDAATIGGNDDVGLQIQSRGDGGINNDASTVTVTDVTSFNNYVGADIDASQAGVVEIFDSAFVSNLSRGIVIDSDSENGADSQVRIVGTNVVGNGQGNTNGAGIAIVQTTDLSIVVFDSTIAHNTGNQGGGIYARIAGADPSVLTIVNSTISDNTAAIGGGMYLRSNSGAPISVHSATFMANTTTGDSPSTAAIYLQGVDAMFRDSILAGGSDTDVDVDVDDNAIAAFYNSLIENPSLAATPLVSNPADDNIVGVSPQLGPLTDNGGFTLTRLPAATSPVINAGDPEWTDGFITQDQRGEARVSGGRIDIGAVEVQQGLAATGANAPEPTLVTGLLLAVAGGALLTARRRIAGVRTSGSRT